MGRMLLYAGLGLFLTFALGVEGHKPGNLSICPTVWGFTTADVASIAAS
jgi:hypothetical protein